MDNDVDSNTCNSSIQLGKNAKLLECTDERSLQTQLIMFSSNYVKDVSSAFKVKAPIQQ